MIAKPRINLIAAVAQNDVIGAGNRMPWHLPEDLKYFKRVTQGHPVVMGRKTFESIGRLLPDRENRIVTRQADFQVEGARIFSSVEAACEGAGEIFVIGGAEIYRQALPMADRLYITRIEKDFEGDTCFPKWPVSQFRELTREAHPAGEGRDFGYSFVVFERA